MVSRSFARLAAPVDMSLSHLRRRVVSRCSSAAPGIRRFCTKIDSNETWRLVPGAVSAKKFPGVKPTIKIAEDMPREYHEFKKDVLLIQSSRGDHAANEERCVERWFA